MTVNIKELANGQLPASKTTLYICPASTQAIIKTISVVNTHTSAVTINLYKKKSGGTSRRFTPVDLSIGIGYQGIERNEITLEAGGVIEGDASVADKVDYIISGVENA